MPVVRIAFVTAVPEVVGDADADRPLHEETFARAGIELDYRIWSDPGVDWSGYDLVVIRSPWDYVPRLDEYREWLLRVDRLGTLHNPARLVEWNLDKRYLVELSAAGVPVIPTRVAETDSELLVALTSSGEELVVKPVVSAGSMDTGRFEAGDPRATALGRRILATGTAVMVQPAVSSVAARGEVSTVLFGGEISHTFRKGPILALGGGFMGQDYEEQIEAENLSVEQRRVVRSAIDAVSRIAAGRLGVTVPPLYARVDVVVANDHRELVLEVELNEPSFFLPVDNQAADRFVAAVHGRARG